MCNLSEGIEEKGRDEGRREERTDMIINIMDLHSYTFDMAADFIGLQGSDREDYRKAVAARKKKSHA